jgi:ABC-type sugar transport system substrate-binding protein
MRKLICLALAALLALSLVPALAEDITIAVVPKSLDNAIFLDAKTAAEEVGKELGLQRRRRAQGRH